MKKLIFIILAIGFCSCSFNISIRKKMSDEEFIKNSITVLREIDRHPDFSIHYLFGDKWELYKKLRCEWQLREFENKFKGVK